MKKVLWLLLCLQSKAFCLQGVYFFGEYLYAKPFAEDSMNWVQDPFGDRIIHYEWNSGFQVGAGYQFPEVCSECDPRPAFSIEANYERYRTHGSDQDTGALHPTVPIFAGGDDSGVGAKQPSTFGATTAQSMSQFHYDRLDAFFLWPFWVARNVTWQAKLGGSGIWLTNHWKSYFQGVTTPPPGPTPLGDQITDLTWKFGGGGLLLGLNLDIDLRHDLGLFANASGAFAYGESRNRSVFTEVGTGFTQLKKTLDSLKQIYCIQAGIDYHKQYDWVKIILAAGYEMTWFVDMNQFGRWGVDESDFRNTFFLRPPMTTGLQGVTARLTLEF